EHDNWKLLIYQCSWTVLELSRRISFSMDIRDFLQFQCSFQCNGIIDIPPHIYEGLGPKEFLRKPTTRVRNSQHMLNPGRKMLQRLNRRFHTILCGAPYLCNVSGKKKQRRELSRETFCRCNCNFVTRVRQKCGIGGP